VRRTPEMEIDFVDNTPVTATWTGHSGTVHTVSGRIYRHTGQLYLAGRRLSWLLESGAVLIEHDAVAA